MFLLKLVTSKVNNLFKKVVNTINNTKPSSLCAFFAVLVSYELISGFGVLMLKYLGGSNMPKFLTYLSHFVSMVHSNSSLLCFVFYIFMGLSIYYGWFANSRFWVPGVFVFVGLVWGCNTGHMMDWALLCCGVESSDYKTFSCAHMVIPFFVLIFIVSKLYLCSKNNSKIFPSDKANILTLKVSKHLLKSLIYWLCVYGFMMIVCLICFYPGIGFFDFSYIADKYELLFRGSWIECIQKTLEESGLVFSVVATSLLCVLPFVYKVSVGSKEFLVTRVMFFIFVINFIMMNIKIGNIWHYDMDSLNTYMLFLWFTLDPLVKDYMVKSKKNNKKN